MLFSLFKQDEANLKIKEIAKAIERIIIFNAAF